MSLKNADENYFLKKDFSFSGHTAIDYSLDETLDKLRACSRTIRQLDNDGSGDPSFYMCDNLSAVLEMH